MADSRDQSRSILPLYDAEPNCFGNNGISTFFQRTAVEIFSTELVLAVSYVGIQESVTVEVIPVEFGAYPMAASEMSM